MVMQFVAYLTCLLKGDLTLQAKDRMNTGPGVEIVELAAGGQLVYVWIHKLKSDE